MLFIFRRQEVVGNSNHLVKFVFFPLILRICFIILDPFPSKAISSLCGCQYMVRRVMWRRWRLVGFYSGIMLDLLQLAVIGACNITVIPNGMVAN